MGGARRNSDGKKATSIHTNIITKRKKNERRTNHKHLLNLVKREKHG